MTTFRKILSTALLTAATLPALAQTNGSNSPYSRYGFGLLNDGGNAFNKAMSGTALGMRNGTQLNYKNPASYSAIDSLSFLFDFGMSLQNANISQSGLKTNAKNTTIDYISAGFRLAPNLGMSVGLTPFSTAGYSTIREEKFHTGHDDYRQALQFKGDGGLHEVYAGIGWAPFKFLSIGMNAGYLWGNLDHLIQMSYDDAHINSTRQLYTTDIRTYKLDFGLQYIQPINSKNTLTLGLTYGLGHDMKSKAYYYNQKFNNQGIVGADTLVCQNAFELPHTFGVGLTWAYKNSLRVGVDYNLQKWGDLKYPNLTKDPESGKYVYSSNTGMFTDMHKVSAGIEYVPDPEGLKWRKRVRYRAGFAYSSPYTKIDGQDGPQNFLASLGVSLPIINMHNNRTFVNISAQYEHVKPQFAGMLTENYLRLCIGISFNERWFMKWKAQ